MKYIFFLIPLCIFSSCDKGRKIIPENLDFRNQIWYDKATDEPAQGKMIETYPNGGGKRESQYLNGMLNGKSIFWNAEGMKMSEKGYKEGKIHGIWLVWNTNGDLVRKTDYSDGELHGEDLTFYTNGTPKFLYNYMHGRESGVWTTYHKNGAIASQGVYDFKPEDLDLEMIYVRDTVLHYDECTGENSVGITEWSYYKLREGEWKYYDELSDLISIDYYENGEVIRTKVISPY